MIAITLPIVSGLPFAREFVVTLPTGRSWWTSLGQFEARCQIRDGKTQTSRLIADLTGFLTTTKPSTDEVHVLLNMTGSQTREVTASGFYDVILSDAGTTDGRAIVICKGVIKQSSIVTAGVA